MDHRLPIRSLDYTVIFARDLAAMRDFYASTMGFPLHRDGQSLASQTPAVRQQFNAAFGNAAAVEWVRQHHAARADGGC